MAEGCGHGSGSSAVDQGARRRDTTLAADPVEAWSAGTGKFNPSEIRARKEKEEQVNQEALRWEEKMRMKKPQEEEKLKNRFSRGSSLSTEDEAEKSRRHKEQKEAYNEALREKKERKDETRKAYASQPTRIFLNYPKRRGCGYSNRFMSRLGGSTRRASGGPSLVPREEEEETGLEPLFFDEAEALADHAAAEEKRKHKEQEELEEARDKELLRQRWKAHMSTLKGP